MGPIGSAYGPGPRRVSRRPARLAQAQLDASPKQNGLSCPSTPHSRARQGGCRAGVCCLGRATTPYMVCLIARHNTRPRRGDGERSHLSPHPPLLLAFLVFTTPHQLRCCPYPNPPTRWRQITAASVERAEASGMGGIKPGQGPRLAAGPCQGVLPGGCFVAAGRCMSMA